jgi:hypothetical protein
VNGPNVRYWLLADKPKKRNRCRHWGVKRTCLCALQMSAYDPKRTSPYETFLPLRPNLLCLISVVPRPSNGMVACTGEIS